jgi:MFS family permease
MSSAIASRRLKQLQWLAIGLCTAAIAVNYLDRATIAIANVKIREEFGLSATAMGALQSAWSLCFAFAQIPTGFIVDRLGPYRLLGAALVLWSLAQTLGGFTSSYLQLIWARGVLGVFEAPAYPTSVRVTSNWFRSEHRGVPTGVFNTGASIGQSIAPPLLTALMLAFGWRTMFIAMGLIGLLFGAVWFLLYRDPEHAALPPDGAAYLAPNAAERTSHVTGGQWLRLFRFRTTWAMILGSFGSGYSIWMYFTWLPAYLETQHHMSIAKTGLLATIPMLASVTGSLAGGFFTDRLARRGMELIASRRLPTVCGYIASAVMTACAAATNGPGMALLFISLSLLCLSFGIAAKWTLITAVTPQTYCASASAIQNFGGYIGGTLSPIVTGYVLDVTGSFVVALGIGATITGLAAGMFLFGVRTRIRAEDLDPDLRLAAA